MSHPFQQYQQPYQQQQHQQQQHQQQQQPHVEDGPIPFFGGGAGGPPPRNAPLQHPPYGQQRVPPQQQRPPAPYQQQQQQQQQQGPPPQRHPQQHPQQQQQHGHPFQQRQPSRQMNQSPFAPAADLFASPPNTNQQPQPQGYQPGVPAATASQQLPPPPRAGAAPPFQQGRSGQQAGGPPARPPLQQQPPQPQQQQQQQQHPRAGPPSGPAQRNPQAPSVPFQPPTQPDGTPFAPAASLFGGASQGQGQVQPGQNQVQAPPPQVQQGAPAWNASQQSFQQTQPVTPQLADQQGGAVPPPANSTGRPPLPPVQRMPSQQGPPRSGSGGSTPQSRSTSFSHAPLFSGPPVATPRQGPVSAATASSAAGVQQSPSPYANHMPPKTPLLQAIQTPLMLPAQTAQTYQTSRTPYMGPLRSGFSSTSQLQLIPCPFPECGGENKPQAKFCSECGRSIGNLSRSATPSLTQYAEFQPTEPAPPMPQLDRMHSFTQEYQNSPQQGVPTSASYDPQQQQPLQQDTIYQQQPDQASYQQDVGQAPLQQDYQNYGDQGYYAQHQYYDAATGQYIPYDGSYDPNAAIAQPAVVAEPEPEPEPELEEYIVDDPLDRMHGCPLIAFGFGGKIMTTFPRTVQRFTSASSIMVTKRFPGDLQLQHLKDFVPVSKTIASYPGPLLMDSAVQFKAKRKDLSKLIDEKIKELDGPLGDADDDAHQVLLWKLFKVMFDHDGVLTGGPKVDEAVRSVLLSIPLTLFPENSVIPPQASTGSVSLDTLQDLLRRGDRAGAVHYAIKSHLWAHALVISSCVNKDLWKEAVNAFVQNELSMGNGDVKANGREALRVLYALFSGQSQNAIQEILPSSLRHKEPTASEPQEDQFVTGASLSLMKPPAEPKVPSESLAQWRDTLATILSNRTAGDQNAISTLGNLLLKEGWVGAAHICFLLSPQASIHSGVDTEQNRLVFIGADFSPHAPYPFYKNVNAFQKTEIYEFAGAIKSSGATGGLPFLQAYKISYAWTLVENGMFSEAARYLEAVEAIVKANTKGSPYYHVVFNDRLKELSERIQGSSQLAATG
ncbi:vesicle coat component, partial [Actinomortierella ambigua]